MQNLTNISKMDIEYRNDENSANKLISFIIDFLLESNYECGETIGTREFKENVNTKRCGEGYKDELS